MLVISGGGFFLQVVIVYWATFAASMSLIVINNVGVQLVSITNAGWSTRQFLEADGIEDVVIYEAVTAVDVRPVLGFILEGNVKTVTIAFEGLLPGLDVLREVYRVVRREIGIGASS